MAITISRPEISRRPDILDNGKQRINPETGRPLWVPQVCIKMENDGAADADVCVTIYRIERRRRGRRLVKACTQRKTLPKKDVHPLGSMTTIVKVCCDLDFPPTEGAEFIAAWEPAGAGPCGDVKVKKTNRSKKLRVKEMIEMYIDSGEKRRHAMYVGLGMEHMEANAPALEIAAKLPIGWDLEIEAEEISAFPALITYSVQSNPSAYMDEFAEISFRVVDDDGVELDEDSTRFGIGKDPSLPDHPKEKKC